MCVVVESNNSISSAGTMDIDPIIICGSQVATATHNNNEILDADDILVYYLHEGSGTALVNPITFSNTPNFSFQPGMSYGTTYYISAVVGNDNGSGGVDLTDPCLSVASGTPVVFSPSLIGASLTAPDTACAGSTVVLIASGGDSYSWGIGPFTSPTLPYTVSQGNANPVSVTITDTASGCDTTISVSIYGMPVVNFSIAGDNPLCAGTADILFIEPPSAVNTRVWGDGSMDSTLVIAPLVTTTYSVTGYKDGHCPATDSVTITVTQPPVADAGADFNVCEPMAVLSAALSGGGEGSWEALGGAAVAMPGLPNTGVSGLSVGGNLFVWTATSPPCPGEAVDTVSVVYAEPSPVLTNDVASTPINTLLEINVLENDSLTGWSNTSLELIIEDENGEWQLQSDGSLTFSPSAGFTGSAAAVYEVCGIVCDTLLCLQGDIKVQVLRCEDDIGKTILVTANSDGLNDFLHFPCVGQYPDNSIVIINRWGSPVFRAAPYQNDWDGEELPTGTYYFVLKLNGIIPEIWGNVLLMR